MSTTDVDHPGEQRGRRASQALVWSLVNTGFGKLGTLAIGIALARMLGPDEFGTYAVAFIALMAILSFNELGVSLAIVRWPEDPAGIVPTVNTISLTMSGALTVLAVVLAPSFATSMGDPGAASLIQLLSVCVLINGLVATPAALLQRYFRQDQRTVADQVNVWVGAGVSILMAVAGAGAISLVVGRLAGATISAFFFLRFSPLPYRVGFDRRHARHLLSFGTPLAGASLLVFMAGFVDQIMVGRILGASVLGFYVLAANLASWPVTMFSQPLRSVAPALFARLQCDPDQMSEGFRCVLRPLCVVALPVCVALSAAAPDVVRFVYGPEWAPASGVLRWLALLAALRIFFEFGYDYLVVLRRSGMILTLQVVTVIALLPALYVGIDVGGIDGAAGALVVVAASISLPLYLREFRRAGTGLRVVFNAVLAPLVVAGLVGIVVLVACDLLGTVPALAVTATTSALAAGAMLFVTRRDLAVFRTVASS